MSCGCTKPEKATGWTPIPEYRQPTDMLPGENMDCYAKRAGTQGKNDIAETIPNRIDNTFLGTDLTATVNEQFKLTPNSTRTPTSWTATINGAPLNIPGLTFTNGLLSGTVATSHQNKTYQVLIAAVDATGEIDSRSFTFVPKIGSKDDTVKFIFPLPGARVTCKFGPRKPPAPGASSMHKGMDCASGRKSDIVSAADGTVVRCGPGAGWGNVIFIEHKDGQNRLVATTVYGHWSEAYVKVGQKVAAGQKIAREGNAGIGSGPHLHFEIHKGSFGNPVDPIPYLNGNFDVAQNNLPGQYGVPDDGSYSTKNNANVGMTSTEANADSQCPVVLQNQSSDGFTGPVVEYPPETLDTQSAIRAVLDADTRLDAEDRKLLFFMAGIESSFKADAANSVSSARGVYQMLDKTANTYYGKINVAPTINNRNNPTLATKAQVEFYVLEQKPYWTNFIASNRTIIAGKPLALDVQARYATIQKGEFIYGLIHHDGVGNAVAGLDRQGRDYYRKKGGSAVA